MHTPGSRWRVALEQDTDVAFALYVRDVLGIGAGPDLPAVSPPPARLRPPPVPPGVLAAAWSSWWSALVDPGRPAARAGPEPPAFAAELRPGYAAWQQERRRSAAGAVPIRELLAGLPALVAAASAEVGRPDPDFTLVLTELPTDGWVWTETAPGQVLVSRAALADEDQVRRGLLAVLGRPPEPDAST